MLQTESITDQTSPYALRYRAYTLFFTGSLVTRIGDWMDLVVLNWFVYQATSSPLHLGIVNACRLLPTFLLSIPGGILADRFDRRKILIWIQVGFMLFTWLLGYVTAEGFPFWVFVSIVTIRSMLTSLEIPVRNAYIPNLVPEIALASAISLYTTALNLSRMIGPAIAGFLLGVWEPSWIFYVNGWATIGVLYSLIVIRLDKNRETSPSANKASLLEVVIFIREKPAVQALLLLAIIPMIFGFPYTTMLPVFVKDLLGYGPEGFGLLLSISSIGAVLGTLWLSLGKGTEYAGRWLVCSIIGFGLSLLLLLAVKEIIFASFAMFLVGVTSQTYRTMSRITLQAQVPDQLRGRILSIALMDRGFIPIGAMLIGSIAGWAGAFWAGVVMGAGCILVTLGVLWSRKQIWTL